MGWVKAFGDGASLPAVRNASGRWAGPALGKANATHTLGQGHVRVMPLYVPACTLNRIGCEITTSVASALVRLGIYEDDGEGRPESLLLDAGTVDASTTGAKEITISQGLSAGLYWLAFMADTASSSIGYRGLENGTSLAPIVANSSAEVFLGANTYRDGGNASGALPDPFVVATVEGGCPTLVVRFD